MFPRRCAGKPADQVRIVEADLGIGEIANASDLAAASRALLSAAMRGDIDISDLRDLRHGSDRMPDDEVADIRAIVEGPADA